jgi:Flp pilus assembly protein CpaB
VVGALLIAVAAVVVFGAWLSARGSDGRPWVVAAAPLSAGTTLTAADLTEASMTLSGAAGAQAFADAGPLLGRVLAAPVAAGGLVQSGDLVPGGQQPLLRPVTVTDSTSDVADLQIGTAVDVLVTVGDDSGARTALVVRGAQVISLTRATSTLGDDDQATVTLGVRSLAEVEAVVEAGRQGTLAVVVAEPSDGTGLGPAGSG